MDTPTIVISEIFHSVQGEGSLVGIPSVFVRTSGCNLRCVWCDTPYTSWKPTGDALTVDAVLERVRAFGPVRHVVLTGGEPLIAPQVAELARQIKHAGYHLTVETAGTCFVDMPVDLWSISPKLAGSTPGPEHGAWHERHGKRRIDLDVLRRLADSAEYQLKFVVSQPGDLEEIRLLVAQLEIAEPERVLLMPEARSVEELDARQAWVADACREHGFRYCDRLHIRLFGNTPGT